MKGLAGLVVALACVGVMAGDAAAFTASYDQKATQGRNTYVSKVTLKDEQFRMETVVGGQQSIIIRNEAGTFTVMPSEGMAMRIDQLAPGQGKLDGAENYAAYLQENQAVKTGTETISGVACDVYEFTEPESGAKTKAWVSQAQTFPVRLEIDGKGGPMVVELSNVQLNVELPDSQFELPPGVQVMDMGGLMGMMQGRQ